jgi:hypothetical protein
MQVETLAEQIYFNTVHLQAKNETESWTGTGFVYAVNTSSGVAHYLVSNEHVFAGASELAIRMVKAGDDGQPELGSATQARIIGFNDSIWIGHPDVLVDVAVIPLYSILVNMIERKEPPFFRAVSPDVSLDVGIKVDLDALEAITFIGYPNGLYDTANLLPIARRGTTATPITVDYQGKPAFLIDASVFPGSSGSPVYIVNQGIYTDRLGNSTFGRSRLVFLGVLAAVHTRKVGGHVEVAPTALMATFDEPIDLGIVFKARCVDECVQISLAAAGLKRQVASAPTPEDSGPTMADKAVSEAQAD